MINKAALVACTGFLFAWLTVQGGGVVEDTKEETYPVGAQPSLTIRNTDGRVFVYGSEDGEIKVKAYTRAFTKERLSQIKSSVAVEGDAMTIDTSYPPAAAGLLADRSGTVEYTVLVPQNCAVKVELSQGEIQFEGLRGLQLEGRLTNGRISLRNCFAPTQVTLGSGGIDVFYAWWEELAFAAKLDVQKGDISLHLSPKAALQLDAATQSGHVRNYFPEESEHGEDVQQLNTAIGGGSDVQFQVRTADGNIKVDKAY